MSQIVIDKASLQGKRESNEDKDVVVTNITGEDKNLLPVNVYGVFDGHGGKFVSKFLADYLPHIMMSNKVSYPLKKSVAKKIFRYLQKYLKDNYSRYATETGSTCLFVAQYTGKGGDYLDIINIGDSKCIMCRKNMAIPLTKEHRPSSFEEHSRITALGGEITQSTNDDPRIHGLSVSRSVGDLYAHPHVTPDPDLYRYRLTNDDKFIVLGCDGLYDYCTETEIVTFVLRNCYDPVTKQRTTSKIAKKLAQYAIDKGSTDNVSVIVVFFK
jgi:serine/threonine protein phosphatase PrpC